MPLRRHALVTALLAIASVLLALPALASAASELEAEVSPLTFPATGIHDQSTAQSTVITNNGDAGASLGNVTASTPFSIDTEASDCDNNLVLAEGASCNLVVRFSPQALGQATGSANIEYSDFPEGQTLETLEIPTSGEGVTGTLAGGSLNFSTQPFYFGGQQQQVNVTNVSSYTALAENTTISGPDAGVFNINFSSCNGNLLQPGANCSVNVQFNPTAAGSFHASLEIQNDGTASPVVIPLEATALAGPKAVIAPDSVDFGIVKVGTTAPSETVTIANAGDFPLQIQQLLIISGTPTIFPVSGDTCSGLEIAPGDECEVSIAFAPTRNGERNASIFVITNTPGPVTIASLTGEGLTAPSGTVELTTQAKVGVPITCLTNGYRNADERSYQWLRGGVAIPDATQSIYIPVETDVGSTLSCELTVENAVGTQTVTSTPRPRSSPARGRRDRPAQPALPVRPALRARRDRPAPKDRLAQRAARDRVASGGRRASRARARRPAASHARRGRRSPPRSVPAASTPATATKRSRPQPGP